MNIKHLIETTTFWGVNLLLCFCFFIPAIGQETSENLILLEKDNKRLLRNPCMGWGLYDDAADEVQEAGKYWKCQSEAATSYASFFYVRWRWADMEPEEGKYA